MCNPKIDAMEDKLSELYDLAKQSDSEELQSKIYELELDIKYACRTCGEPGERMYDCHNIYAGVYCSEQCCPVRLSYSREEIDEQIDEDY